MTGWLWAAAASPLLFVAARALVHAVITHAVGGYLRRRDERRELAETGPRCPRCRSARIHRHWVAMEDWDHDGWTCLACDHTWAEPAR